ERGGVYPDLDLQLWQRRPAQALAPAPVAQAAAQHQRERNDQQQQQRVERAHVAPSAAGVDEEPPIGLVDRMVLVDRAPQALQVPAPLRRIRAQTSLVEIDQVDATIAAHQD